MALEDQFNEDDIQELTEAFDQIEREERDKNQSMRELQRRGFFNWAEDLEDMDWWDDIGS